MPATDGDVCHRDPFKSPHPRWLDLIVCAAVPQLAKVIDAPGQHMPFPGGIEGFTRHHPTTPSDNRVLAFECAAIHTDSIRILAWECTSCLEGPSQMGAMERQGRAAHHVSARLWNAPQAILATWLAPSIFRGMRSSSMLKSPQGSPHVQICISFG